jgi:hypothetical protein
MNQSSEFCRNNPLCCFVTSNTEGKHIFRYRLSPETFGYTLLFGPKRKKVAGGWRILHNEELHNLHASTNRIRMIRSRKMR